MNPTQNDTNHRLDNVLSVYSEYVVASATNCIPELNILMYLPLHHLQTVINWGGVNSKYALA